jgi:hypothetical protein
MSKTFKIAALFILIFNLYSPRAQAGELWKGHTEVRPFEVGLMTGLSIYGNSAHWGVLGSGAYLLKDKAFVDDLDDRIWFELQMGPSFFSTGNTTSTGLQYSTHLRWDFTYNEYWTFYALGGISGYGLPKAVSNGVFTLHPRFGAGVEYQTKAALIFRGEVSAEFMGLGVAFNF